MNTWIDFAIGVAVDAIKFARHRGTVIHTRTLTVACRAIGGSRRIVARTRVTAERRPNACRVGAAAQCKMRENHSAGKSGSGTRDLCEAKRARADVSTGFGGLVEIAPAFAIDVVRVVRVRS